MPSISPQKTPVHLTANQSALHTSQPISFCSFCTLHSQLASAASVQLTANQLLQLLHTSQPISFYTPHNQSVSAASACLTVSFCTSHRKTAIHLTANWLQRPRKKNTPPFHGAVTVLHLTHGYVLQRNLSTKEPIERHCCELHNPNKNLAQARWRCPVKANLPFLPSKRPHCYNKDSLGVD